MDYKTNRILTRFELVTKVVFYLFTKSKLRFRYLYVA